MRCYGIFNVVFAESMELLDQENIPNCEISRVSRVVGLDPLLGIDLYCFAMLWNFPCGVSRV